MRAPPSARGRPLSRERHHHYIPEFHLRRFAVGPRRDLAVFDKQWGKFGRRPAALSARVLDYYLLPGATTDERLRLERDFARLENLIAPLIGRLDAVPSGIVPFSETDRHNMAMYAAILHVRGPAYRDDALKRARELETDLEAMGLADPTDFRRFARKHDSHESDEQIEATRLRLVRAVQAGEVKVSFSPAASLTGVTTAINRGVPLLLAREWDLLREPAWPGFVIGDQPVTLLSHDQVAPSVGFASPGVLIQMPLSPRTLLRIHDRPRTRPLEVRFAVQPSLGGPGWLIANQVAWVSSQRYVWGSMGALQATESVVRPDLRRRDLRILDEEQEARRRAVEAERRRARREGR